MGTHRPILSVLLSLGLCPATASAQDSPMQNPMKEHVLASVLFEQLELAPNDSGTASWDGGGWVGTDLNRFWFKTEGERADGETEKAELQLLYSHALTAFWDVQTGYRHDFEPHPNRDWAVLSARGVAPYFYELEGSLFIGEGGQAEVRVKASYELLLTQRWIVTPTLETRLYAADDPAVLVGSGLSDLELGLRIRYEIKRELAPYFGVSRLRKFNETADLARAAGLDTGETRFVAGLRFWF